MKSLLLLCLLSSTVYAAPACYPWDSSAKNVETSTSPESKAQFMVTDSARAFFVVTWHCDTKYRWHGYGFAGYRNELKADFLDLVAGYRTASKSTLDLAWGQNMPVLNDLELKPFLVTQLKATEPQPIRWQVRDNPQSTSRPVFLAVNGVRSTTQQASERVSDTAACSCARLVIEESGGTYCSVSGQDNVSTAAADKLFFNRVALCYRVN
jgi:hypothetical protein